MESPPVETRERYPYWVPIPTRWMDGEAQAAAIAFFIHVFVDPHTRRPVPLGEEIKAAMRALMLDA